MTVRSYIPADYSEICGWWKAHNFPVPGPQFLSPRGFVAEMDGVKLAAGWLYMTDSAFGWFEFLVVNPLARLKIRPKAVQAVVKAALSAAKEIGISVVHTSISDKTPSLKRLYSREGFQFADGQMTNYYARVQ